MAGGLKAVWVMKLTCAIVSSSSHMGLAEAVWTSSSELFPVTTSSSMAMLASMLWKWVSVLDIIDIRLATVMNSDFLAVSVVCVCQAWF